VLGGQSSSARMGQTLSVTRILSPMDRLAALLVLVHEVFPRGIEDRVAAGAALNRHHVALVVDGVGRRQSLARLNALGGVSLKGPAVPPNDDSCRLYGCLPVGQRRSSSHPSQDFKHLAVAFVELHRCRTSMRATFGPESVNRMPLEHCPECVAGRAERGDAVTLS
jgi:hypothetical protein